MVWLVTLAAVVAFAALATTLDRPLFARLGSIALAGHVVFAVLVFPSLPYQWDVSWFHETALFYLQGELLVTNFPVATFAAFQAMVYAIFGAETAVLGIVNGFLAVVIVLPIRYIASELYPSASASGAVAPILFLPLPFLFQSVPMRGSLSAVLMFSVLALAIWSINRNDPLPVLLAVPLVALLAHLRTELAILCLLGAGTMAGLRAFRAITDDTAPLSVTVGIVVTVGGAGFRWFARRNPIEALNTRLASRQVGGAAYLPEMSYQSWADVLVSGPARAIYFQYAPFPLHVNSMFDAAAALSLPLLVCLTVCGYRSLREGDRDTDIAIGLLVVYFGGIAGYGLIDSNFGTTVRHRVPFVFLLVIFATPVLDRWTNSLRGRIGERPHEEGHDSEDDGEARELECDV